MHAEQVQEWFSEVAIKLVEKATAQRLTAPFTGVVYSDDRSLGIVGAFIVEAGQPANWNWRPTLEKAEYPVRMVLTDAENRNISAWIRQCSWRNAA